MSYVILIQGEQITLQEKDGKIQNIAVNLLDKEIGSEITLEEIGGKILLAPEGQEKKTIKIKIIDKIRGDKTHRITKQRRQRTMTVNNHKSMHSIISLEFA